MLIEQIEVIAKDAGKIMVTAERPKIMEKSGHANFCTETDEKIQRFLIEKLKEVLPEAEFLGEEDGQDEFTAKMEQGYVFILDPIDGTTNFICSYKPSVVSIGLLKDGKPYIGVVYNPYEDMLICAEAGKGAYVKAAGAHVGGEKIMSADTPLSDSIALFGTAPYYPELLDCSFDSAKKLLPLCIDLRRSGSAVWDLCTVAMGHANLYFEYRVQIWDYAAATLIAQEAGCTVTDIDGNPLSFSGPTSILCRARGVKEIPACFE